LRVLQMRVVRVGVTRVRAAFGCEGPGCVRRAAHHFDLRAGCPGIVSRVYAPRLALNRGIESPRPKYGGAGGKRLSRGEEGWTRSKFARFSLRDRSDKCRRKSPGGNRQCVDCYVAGDGGFKTESFGRCDQWVRRGQHALVLDRPVRTQTGRFIRRHDTRRLIC